MVKNTYSLTPEDAKKLISYACRYRCISTNINENARIMAVYTTSVGNDRPTSIADSFQLDVVSTDPPKMPDDEYKRRVEGKFPEE